MADQSLDVIIRGKDEITVNLNAIERKITGFSNSVSASLSRISLDGINSAIQKQTQAIDVSFRGLEATIVRSVIAVKATIEAAQAVAFPIKQAAEFQKEMLNVQRTTAFTDAQVTQLGYRFLRLSTQIPVAAEKLAEIANIAGRLGIGHEGVKGLEEFTATIARFSADTGVGVERSAIAFGKMINLFKLTIDQTENLSAALVTAAHTSKVLPNELIDATLRLGSAGGILTPSQSIALTSTGVSLGQTPETTGTGFIRMFANMEAKAGEFADFMGKTTNEWVTQLRQEPIAALQAVLEKLNAIGTGQGGMAARAATISKLLTDGGRQLSLVNKLLEDARAGQESVLTRLVNNGAFDKGTAALREQETTLKGLSAQWQLLSNSVSNLGTEVGSAAVPGLITFVKDLQAVAQGPDIRRFIFGISEIFGDLVNQVKSVSSSFVDLSLNITNILSLLKLFVEVKIGQALVGWVASANLFNKAGAGIASMLGALDAGAKAPFTKFADDAKKYGKEISGLSDLEKREADAIKARTVATEASTRARQAEALAAKAQADADLRRADIGSRLIAAKTQRANVGSAIFDLRQQQTDISKELQAFNAAAAPQETSIFKKANSTVAAQNANIARSEAKKQAADLAKIEQDRLQAVASITATSAAQRRRAEAEINADFDKKVKERIALTEVETKRRIDDAAKVRAAKIAVQLDEINRERSALSARLAITQEELAKQLALRKEASAEFIALKQQESKIIEAIDARNAQAQRQVAAAKAVELETIAAATRMESAVGGRMARIGLQISSVVSAIGFGIQKLGSLFVKALNVGLWVSLAVTIADMLGVLKPVTDAFIRLGEAIGLVDRYEDARRKKQAIDLQRAQEQRRVELANVESAFKVAQSGDAEFLGASGRLTGKSAISLDQAKTDIGALVRQYGDLTRGREALSATLFDVPKQSVSDVKALAEAYKELNKQAKELADVQSQGRTLQVQLGATQRGSLPSFLRTGEEDRLKAEIQKNRQTEALLAESFSKTSERIKVLAQKTSSESIAATQSAITDQLRALDDSIKARAAALDQTFSAETVAVLDKVAKYAAIREKLNESRLEEAQADNARNAQPLAPSTQALIAKVENDRNSAKEELAKLQNEINAARKRLGKDQLVLLDALVSGATAANLDVIVQRYKKIQEEAKATGKTVQQLLGENKLADIKLTPDPAEYEAASRLKLQLLRAAAEKEYDIAKAHADRLITLDRDRLQQGLITTVEASQRRYAVERDLLNAQLRKIEADIAETTKQTTVQGDPNISVKAKIDLQRLEAQRDITAQKIKEISEDLANAIKPEIDKLEDTFMQLQSEYLQAQGKTVDATLAGFVPKYRERMKEINALLSSSIPAFQEQGKKQLDIVVGIMGLEKAKADLGELNSLIEVTQSGLTLEESNINLQVSLGLRSELDGLQAIAQARRDYADTLQGQITLYEQLAEAQKGTIEGAQTVARLEEMKQKFQELKGSISDVAKSLNDTLRSSIEENLGAALNRVKSYRDAIKDIGKTIGDAVQKQVIRNVIDTNFGFLFKGPGSFGDRVTGAIGGVKVARGETAQNPLWVQLVNSITPGQGVQGFGITSQDIQAMVNSVNTLTTSVTDALNAVGNRFATEQQAASGLKNIPFDFNTARQEIGRKGGPVTVPEWNNLFDVWAKKYNTEERFGINGDFFRYLALQESNFNPNARNAKSGAAGLFQFIPSTAKQYGLDQQTVYDPAKSIEAGIKYFSDLLEKEKGNINKALVDYNYGIGNRINADASGRPYPAETRQYVGALGTDTGIARLKPDESLTKVVDSSEKVATAQDAQKQSLDTLSQATKDATANLQSLAATTTTIQSSQEVSSKLEVAATKPEIISPPEKIPTVYTGGATPDGTEAKPVNVNVVGQSANVAAQSQVGAPLNQGPQTSVFQNVISNLPMLGMYLGAFSGKQGASSQGALLGSLAASFLQPYATDKSGNGAGATEAISAMFSDASKAIQDGVKGLGDILGGTDGFGGLFSSLGDMFSSLMSGISSIFGFKEGGLPSLEAGIIRGPGTDRSDSILARVSASEYIMPAAQTRMFYPILEAMRSGLVNAASFNYSSIDGLRSVDRLRIPKFADGYAPPSVTVMESKKPAQHNVNFNVSEAILDRTMRDVVEHVFATELYRR